MSFPKPGSKYVVVKGDTLWDIAGAAYGNPRKWKKIYDANKSTLRDPKIYPNTVVLIFPGEILFIPDDKDSEVLKNDSNKKSSEDDNMRFLVEGKEVSFESGKISCFVDTLSDFFSFVCDIGNAPKLKPYRFEKCEAFIGDKKIITGNIFTGQNTSSSEGEFVSITGFSSTKNIIDSSSEPPYVYNGKSLLEVCKKITSNFSIDFEDKISDSYKFKKAKIEKSQKIGDFLIGLAKQRNCVLKSNENGIVEIIRANTNSKPIFTITNDTELEKEISFSYDSSTRFSKTITKNKRPNKNNKGVFKDPNVPVYRVLHADSEEIDRSEIKNVAEFISKKNMINGLQIGFSVGKFVINEELIRENNIVCIERDSLFLNPGINLLITSVEFEQSKDEKKTSVSCSLPQLYNDEPIVENWKELGS